MIRLPAELTPSELLCCEDLSPFVERLIEGSRGLRRQGRWVEARQCVLDAIEASQEVGGPVNRAVAYVDLGDIQREMGKLGPALVAYGRAQRIFRFQSSSRQRHNEAVTTYALGLIHHLLGNDLDALKWYDRAIQLLKIASEHWTAFNALGRVDACCRLRRWVDILSDCLTRSVTCSEMDRVPEVWVPVVLAESRGAGVEQLELQKHNGELVGQINRFRVHPLEEGWSISLSESSHYGAQEIPERICQSLHARRGDHLLIQWDDSLEDEERSRMEEFGQSDSARFLRDADGRIYIIRRPPRIIGERGAGESVRAGYVPALLEPTAPSESAKTLREESVRPPSGDASDETIELYNKLLGLVGGSRRTASGLVEYERRHAPHASLSEVIDRAIVRLLRDRRAAN